MTNKKKYPSSLLIGPVDFQLIFENKLDDPDYKDSEIYGLTHIQDEWIKLSYSKNPTKDKLEKTLFHEIIHAALGVSGVSEIIGDEKMEEGIVVCLENHLWKLVEFRKGLLK